MKTEHLKNYTAGTIQEFYAQGIITQAQYEAYDFAWANTHVTSFPYHVLPENIQKVLHAAVVKG